VYDLVAWFDVDSIIVNLSTSAVDLLSGECPGKHFLVSGNDCDPPPSTNTGLLILSKHESAFRVLNEIISLSAESTVRQHPWWEQHALNQILLGDNVMKDDVCVSRHSLQYFPTAACMPKREGNFLAHAAGARGNQQMLSSLLSIEPAVPSMTNTT
jgi:hypothetical protein